MAFKFPLAAVLKYREDLEKREERILEQRREALACLDNKLAEVKDYRRQLIAQRESLLNRGVLGDDLHHATEQQQQLQRSEEEIRKQVATALLNYDQQMKVFLAARQKREILDELKDAQTSSYREKQDRREQQNIDEIFIARLNRTN
jgi:flagellar FliJ protein